MENIAELQRARYPRADIDLDVKESYRNMVFKLNEDPRVVDIAVKAVERAGIPVNKAIIRGGTDGAMLSYRGLLTPNLFAGGVNFHSKREFIPLESMEAAVRTILELLKLYVEETA